MTTPTGAADERERLLGARPADMTFAEWVEKLRAQVRADAETIQSLQAWKELQLAAAVELRTQLAAQSAELERAKAQIEAMKKRAESSLSALKFGSPNMVHYLGMKETLSDIAALATSSAAGGEKEGLSEVMQPSELPLFYKNACEDV